HDLVERYAVVEVLGQPLQQRAWVELTIVRLARQHQVRPCFRKELAEARIGEQLVDNLFTLIGLGILEKRLDLFRRWDHADQIEIDAAEKLGVVRASGWFVALVRE